MDKMMKIAGKTSSSIAKGIRVDSDGTYTGLSESDSPFITVLEIVPHSLCVS